MSDRTYKNGETFYGEHEVEIGADGFVKRSEGRIVDMSDQLREAIEWVMLVEQTAQPENLGPHTREQIRLVLAAARRWLAVSEAVRQFAFDIVMTELGMDDTDPDDQEYATEAVDAWMEHWRSLVSHEVL